MRRLAILVLAFAAACGDDGPGNLADAPPPPPIPDGPPAPVKVTVTVQGLPGAGVTVHFQNADSSLVGTMTTDADGVASAVMAAGGFVTVIEPDPPITPELGGVPQVDNTLTTWAGVQPGDDLHLDLFKRGGEEGTLVTFDVVVPNDPNASRYQLFTSCGGADITPPPPQLAGGVLGLIAVPNPPVQVTLFGCTQGLADMAVVTFDGKLQPLSSFYKADVAVAENAMVELDGTYAAIPSTSVAVSNVPAALGNLGFDHTLLSPRGFLFNTFEQFQGSGTVTGDIRVPATTGATGVMAVIGFAPNGAFSEQTIVEWGPYSATYALDWGAAAIKDYTSEPELDPATHKISWTLGTTGGTGDVVLAAYSAFRGGGSPEHFWTWRIAAPAGAEVTYPTLPPGQPFDFNAMAGDSLGVDRVTTAKVPGGYAAARARVHDEGFLAGPSGRVSLVDIFRQVKRTAPAARHGRRFVVGER
jgi:hypothetical protein